MQFLKNLKHIFAIAVLSLFILFASIFLFSAEFNDSINSYFIYKTKTTPEEHDLSPFRDIILNSNNQDTQEIVRNWQDTIYKFDFKPSSDIVIIKIDAETLDYFQANTSSKMLTLPKSIYIDTINILNAF